MKNRKYNGVTVLDMIKTQLQPNEILVEESLGDNAHAEDNLDGYASKYGYEWTHGDASSGICLHCQKRHFENKRTNTPSFTTGTTKK